VIQRNNKKLSDSLEQQLVRGSEAVGSEDDSHRMRPESDRRGAGGGGGASRRQTAIQSILEESDGEEDRRNFEEEEYRQTN
jgi:hypothetical protein